jgi:hypothetical protein
MLRYITKLKPGDYVAALGCVASTAATLGYICYDNEKNNARLARIQERKKR